LWIAQFRYSRQIISHLRFEAVEILNQHFGRSTLPILSLLVHRDNLVLSIDRGLRSELSLQNSVASFRIDFTFTLSKLKICLVRRRTMHSWNCRSRRERAYSKQRLPDSDCGKPGD